MRIRIHSAYLAAKQNDKGSLPGDFSISGAFPCRGGIGVPSVRLQMDAALQRAQRELEIQSQHGTVKHWVRSSDGEMVLAEVLDVSGSDVIPWDK